MNIILKLGGNVLNNKSQFNFYAQHESNHRRTRLLNCLLPVVLLIVFLVIYCFFVWGNTDDEVTFGQAFMTTMTPGMLKFFTFVFVIWWIVILIWTRNILNNPISAVMDASHATQVDDQLMSADPKAKMFDNVVTELALAYGMKKPATFIVEDTQEPNAFATGNPDHSGVAITRPLLDMLNREELSGVMGHELAHIAAEDSQTTMRFALFVSGLSFVVIMGWALVRFGLLFIADSDDEHGWQSKAVVGCFSIMGLVIVVAGYIGKLCAVLLKFAMSRTREYDADAMSAKVNQNPNGLIQSLYKIDDWVAQQSGKIDSELSPKFSNLYLVDTKTHLLDDHPSTKDRIERLKEV